MGKRRDEDFDVSVLDKASTGSINMRKYKVILHNDDYTTFEFVTQVLVDIFSKSPEEAQQITLLVHFKGQGIAGIYSKELAETKVMQVHGAAQLAGFPLRASIQAV